MVYGGQGTWSMELAQPGLGMLCLSAEASSGGELTGTGWPPDTPRMGLVGEGGVLPSPKEPESPGLP